MTTNTEAVPLLPCPFCGGQSGHMYYALDACMAIERGAVRSAERVDVERVRAVIKRLKKRCTNEVMSECADELAAAIGDKT